MSERVIRQLPLGGIVVATGLVLIAVAVGSSGSAAPAGISQERAVELAADFVTPDAIFRSARSGRFGDVYKNDRMGPQPNQADQQVWAVEFESEYIICPPDGSPCFSPRPGFTTVILDYYTGDWITTFSYSPPPV